MRRTLRPLALFALVACSREEPSPAPVGEAVQGTAGDVDLTSDDRIADLIFPCSQTGWFGGDTSDLLPAFLEKLRTGQRDPLALAIRELGRTGARALPGLTLIVDECFADPSVASRLHSVLAAISNMPPPLGRELAWRIVEHPDESIRLAALRTLGPRVLPEDLPRLRSMVALGSVASSTLVLEAIARLDAAGLSRDLAGWIERDELEPLWFPAATAIVQHGAGDADTKAVRRAVETLRARGIRPEVSSRLDASLARAGDPATLAQLVADARGEAGSTDGDARARAVEALRDAGRADLLIGALAGLEDAQARTLAIGAIADLPADVGTDAATEAARTEALRAALRDPHDGVRALALRALVHEGDPEAVDLALARLDEGSTTAVREAMAALTPEARQNPALAERVVRALSPRLAELRDQPLASRAQLYEALGTMPSAEAARLLLESARSTPGTFAGLRSHRWFMLQAGNTLPAGSAVLREALLLETDPLRRLDAITVLTGDSSEETVRVLSDIASGTTATSDFEALYVGTRLLRTRPANEIAPLLKRAALRMRDERARRALECVLRRYFGAR